MMLRAIVLAVWLLSLAASLAQARDLAEDEYAAMLAHIYDGRPSAAAALLDSLVTECAGEPLFLIAQARLQLESIPEDDLDKALAKEMSQPVLATLKRAIAASDRQLDAGGDELELRRLRGWAWMVRSQTHAQGRSFYSAGREAGYGKKDLDFYLASDPDDPVANGLLGAFLYFTDAVPAVLKLLSKLVLMPTGDRALGLAMVGRSEAQPSAKVEDFRTLAMTVNVVFEGRWEEGLPQALNLHSDHPAYARLALPLSALRLMAPGSNARLEARLDATEARVAELPVADIDSSSVWMNRTYRAWIDRILLGPGAAEPRFAEIVAAHPTRPDWVFDFAQRQLGELASDRADGLPDGLASQVWQAPIESLDATLAALENRIEETPRAAFWAAECRLRLGELALAEPLYRRVVAAKGQEHLAPFRLVAAMRVGEIKAHAGRYRAASRWYRRAAEHHRDVYRVDWMLEGRARRFEELSQDGDTLTSAPILFATP